MGVKQGVIVGTLLLLVIIAGFAYRYLLQDKRDSAFPKYQQDNQMSASGNKVDLPAVTTIAEGLDTPWGIVFLPDNSMLVTERSGQVRFIDRQGKLEPTPVATLQNAKEAGEGGLLGIALHPDFASNSYVYLYYTYQNSGINTLNRVVRMIFTDRKLSNEEVIVDRIPGSSNHNGGRIKFGPDRMLYIGTGDAGEPTRAQNKDSLAGKILRVTDSGGAIPGNPFNNLVFSLGHRNVQGLTWDSNNKLWATEHGRSGLLSGFDELNMIEAGKDYGWPDIEGDKTRSGMEIAKRHSGATTTWAPSGAAFLDDSVYFSGLRGQSLYRAIIKDDRVIDFKEYLKGQFGRIREVVVGPDEMLYISTSNKDGRGSPSPNDDRIIRLNPAKL
jgi:glucose/arabinose dehydrogenase